MDDSQEPSYYEIALTNRQVLVFFVVLLVCVVGAFFSGIWLGQQRSAGRPATVEAAAEEPAVEEGDDTLAELNFFSDDQPSPPGAAAARRPPAETIGEPHREPTRHPETIAPTGSPETTLLEDLNGSRAAASPAERAPSGASPSVPEPAPSATGGTAPAEGGFVIQVFSSPDDDQARKVLDRLTSGGYQAFISPVDVDGRVMHRVRVGPFAERDEAETVAIRVKGTYRLDTWVTPND